MRTQSLRTIGWLAVGWMVSACGGGSTAEPPAKAGAAAPSASSAKAPEAAPGSDGGAVSEPAPTEKKADGLPPGKEGPKPSRPPHDVLTQKDTLFMLSFDESDAGKAADATCNKAGSKDPKKVATCIGKERGQIEADGHGFKKDKEGKLTWVVVHRQGNILLTIHKMHMTFANETDNTISVKPEGKDTGKKPGKGAGDFTVEVPSDYRIVISDPRFGKLVYEAKIGLVPDNLL
jgi:hypothetical protein